MKLFLDPCLNGATCKDDINRFKCICKKGFNGNQCETEINDCDPSPCLNGATCTDYFDSYVCNCAVSYNIVQAKQ